ncbi:MAG TPA: histidinol-phosphate transaminase [Methanospirillum sp.]|uniref:histidinol-phosphate transaminase n=1 Tax=Methanospirillum sp. TaxID=45200 RepID=UPI002BF352CA|nr:histidinol-phosphate transaminase [Methanospirillum sp.]HWQ64423.1 histidinol-phosphate transaminase [Methanospirillum sp.]
MQQSVNSLVRDIYQQEGYVYARSPEEIAETYGFSRVARLASNENPFGPSPLAVAAVQKALATVHRYPDTGGAGRLIQALRDYHGDYEFVTGVGMDGVIETCIRVLVNPGEVVAVSVPTFSFYGLAAKAQGAEIIKIPRRNDFTVDVGAFISAAKNAKIAFLCSPNNPTGTMTSPEDVERIADALDGILFLDNAYVEFSEIDYRSLMQKHDNLVIGRTMSKVFGLAGCRIGYAFVPSWLKPVYEKAATPFTVNTLSLSAATGALDDKEYVERTIRHVRSWIQKFHDICKLPVLPGGANFVMIDTAPMSGDECAARLAEKGIIVRSCRSFPGLADHYIRVCVGEDWECEQFLSGINQIC